MEVVAGDERGALLHCVLRLSQQGIVLAAQVPPSWPFSDEELVGRPAPESLPAPIWERVAPAPIGLSAFECSVEWGESLRRVHGLVSKEGSGEVLVILYDDFGHAQKAFALRILDIQEKERSHLARELHDAIGQRLLVHRLDAEWLVKRSQGPMREAAEGLCRALDETLEQVRRLAGGLRPPELDNLGLGPALQALADDISRRGSIRCDCDVELTAEQLTPEASIALYRIAQEAVVNAVRHAGCAHISVRLKRTSGPEAGVEMRVEDDGRGIQPAEVRGARSLGLVGMRERAEILGGEVTIRKGEKCGTVVLTRLPKAVMRWERK